jgi:hypothetical protein
MIDFASAYASKASPMEGIYTSMVLYDQKNQDLIKPASKENVAS